MSKINNDTHKYDNIIGPLYRIYVSTDNNELETPESIVSVINQIKLKIFAIKNEKLSCDALRAIKLIATDTYSNYDIKNNIQTQDILTRTWRFIKHYDNNGIECFIEQLADIMNGSCSQGRTTRIFQFYEYHMITKDDIYQKVKKK